MPFAVNKDVIDAPDSASAYFSVQCGKNTNWINLMKCVFYFV